MVEFDVKAKPLPSNFRGTPQQLLEAILSRLEIIDDKATFVISDVQPTTNVGPWFKNGKQLWVWDSEEETYIPLDTSEGVLSQVAIQAEAPDPAEYSYWFQVSTGPVSSGLYYYLDGAWTKPDSAVTPGSLTEEKAADGAVTSANLLAPIRVLKWEPGAANSFARTNLAGTAGEWDAGRLYSPQIPLAVNAKLEFLHNLGHIPAVVDAWLRPIVTETHPATTFFAGEPVHWSAFQPVWGVANAGLTPPVVTPTSIYVRTQADLLIQFAGLSQYLPDPANWTIQFVLYPL
jgi:hypothetical protein